MFFEQGSFFSSFYHFKYRINQYDAILQICFKEIMNLDGIQIPRTESIYQTIRGLGIDRSAVLALSSFVGQLALFQPIFTGEGLCHDIPTALEKKIQLVFIPGLCYTFNAVNSAELYSDELSYL